MLWILSIKGKVHFYFKYVGTNTNIFTQKTHFH